MQRVVITGMGVVCPIGLNTDSYWTSLVEGKSGVGFISHFDASNYPVKLAGEVKGFNPADHLDSKTVQRTPRCVHLVIPALREAVAQAGLNMADEQPERVGVVSANMLEYQYVGEDWERLKQRGPKRVDPLLFTKAGPSTVSLQVGMLLGAKGPNTTVNSLCASGTDVIATARNFIQFGYADVMIAAASDASLGELGIASISLLGALTKEPDPEKASRPFDLNRSGFVYGEGAGVLVLESLEHARKHGAPVLAEVAGAGWSFDAYDATAPQPETEAVAMRNALNNGGVRPEDVDYINAHGTSTKLNDRSETEAIKMVFGEQAYQMPVSSFKSMFGHMVTAAGAVESIGAVLAINNGAIPPTIHYETPDPECDLDYVPNVARKARVNVCLKSSFGLGGQNCCLVLKRFTE
ncbi:MAG: beta-ketoacyl-[acyl-carrier-protein] synthase II [Dehalococcoidales bacterium]|nr:beta-ketoacyl-[acyl-carrier-protein] synthase II [Dehalococcoidales bacterium]